MLERKYITLDVNYLIIYIQSKDYDDILQRDLIPYLFVYMVQYIRHGHAITIGMFTFHEHTVYTYLENFDLSDLNQSKGDASKMSVFL